jgi:hypothetical protein
MSFDLRGNGVLLVRDLKIFPNNQCTFDLSRIVAQNREQNPGRIGMELEWILTQLNQFK